MANNRLPWDIFTKTVRKTPQEVYESLLDRRMLTPLGQTNRAQVIEHINHLLHSMDAVGDVDVSPYTLAEQDFLQSGYVYALSEPLAVSPTSSGWPRGNISAAELPPGYEIVKYFSPHVARARINLSGKEDGTIIEVLLKKSGDDSNHEFEILQYLQARWVSENGENARPPFPTDTKKLADGLFEEEFIYSRPLVPTPDEHPEPVFKRVEPLLKAIEWLHQHQVIHGDLNVNNVLVTSSSVRLIDFGNARCPGINESGFRSGTPLYRAPEAFDIAPTTQMDIFSLGCTLYLLFFGSLPYDEHYRRKKCRHVLQPRLKSILEKAISIAAEDRHISVEQLRLDLTKALNLD